MRCLPPHIHSREEESFFAPEGEITFHLGDDRIVVGEGTFINMPASSCMRLEWSSSGRRHPAQGGRSLVCSGPKKKATLRAIAKWLESGGGGIRTRVP